MTLSKDDALALLSKWLNEQASIFAIIISSMGEFRLGGMISGFTDTHLFFSPRPRNPNAFYLKMNIADAFDFDYSDPREAPDDVSAQATERVTGMLRIGVPGATIALFEIEVRTQAE